MYKCRFGGRDGDRGRGGRDSGPPFRGGGGSSFGGGMRNDKKEMLAGANLRKPNWDMSRLTKFEKNFYKEHPSLTARSDVSVKYDCLVIRFYSIKH